LLRNYAACRGAWGATNPRVASLRKELDVMDTNYLRDSLKAAGAEQVSTCKLCGALVNSSYLEAHNRGDR
jgi:hypothetical protein